MGQHQVVRHNHPKKTRIPMLKTATALLISVFSVLSAQPAARITVGKNAMVSADRPQHEQGEAVICASPTDPNLLIAAATTTSHGGQFQAAGEVTFEMVYYSRDRS